MVGFLTNGLSVFLLASAWTAEPSPTPKVEPAAPQAEGQKENWKGEPSLATWNFGGFLGAGVIADCAGPALAATASRKIVHRGFASDIDNQVHLELVAGPQLYSKSLSAIYGVHLRWDFQMDPNWRFYALGGLAGSIPGSKLVAMGAEWSVFPRFGIGAFLRLADSVALRGEVSHELMGLGAVFIL